MGGMGRPTLMVRPARRGILADEVANSLREAIFSGQLELGQRLFEEDLAVTLKVSRGPVREALVVLSQEGLVRSEPHKGATVAEMGPEAVQEMYSLRKALDRVAAEWACQRATEYDFSCINDVLEQFKRLERPFTRPEVAALDIAFHDAVVRSAHHARLYRAWLSLRSQMFLYLVKQGMVEKDFARSWLDDHEQYLAALLQRKPRQAIAAAERHIDRPYRRAIGAMRGSTVPAP